MKDFVKQKYFIIPATVFIVLTVWMNKIKGDYQFFDTKLFYQGNQVLGILHALDHSGREAYRLFNELDFIFMFSYTALFYVAYKEFFRENAPKLFIVPALLAIVDCIENSAIFYLIREYPNGHTTIATILAIATSFKWFLALSSLLILVNGYVVSVYMKSSEGTKK